MSLLTRNAVQMVNLTDESHFSLGERNALHMHSMGICMQLLGGKTKAWGSQNKFVMWIKS